MKRLFILSLLVVFFFSPVMAAEKINLKGQKCEFPDQDQWAVCEKDSDCEVVFNQCGFLTAVNMKYTVENDEYALCVGPMISCAVPDEGQKKENAAAACVNKKCVVVPAVK